MQAIFTKDEAMRIAKRDADLSIGCMQRYYNTGGRDFGADPNTGVNVRPAPSRRTPPMHRSTLGSPTWTRKPLECPQTRMIPSTRAPREPA